MLNSDSVDRPKIYPDLFSPFLGTDTGYGTYSFYRALIESDVLKSNFAYDLERMIDRWSIHRLELWGIIDL